MVIWVLLRHCLLSMISAANLVESFTCMLMGSEIAEVALPQVCFGQVSIFNNPPYLMWSTSLFCYFPFFLSSDFRRHSNFSILGGLPTSWIYTFCLYVFFLEPRILSEKKPAPKMDLMRPSSATNEQPTTNKRTWPSLLSAATWARCDWFNAKRHGELSWKTIPAVGMGRFQMAS